MTFKLIVFILLDFGFGQLKVIILFTKDRCNFI